MDDRTAPLVADRFLRAGAGALDLASGRRVWLRVTAGRPPDAAWAERCVAWFARQSPVSADFGRRRTPVEPAGLVELVDYGAIGPASRFEAFAARAGGGPASAAAARVLPRALRLFDDGDAGEDQDAVGPPAAWTAADQMAELAEFLETPRSGGTPWMGLHVPGPSCVAEALRLAAREARIRGFVPVGGKLASAWDPGDWPRLVAALRGRAVVVLGDPGGVPAGTSGEDLAAWARAVLALGAAGPKATVAFVSVTIDQGPAAPSAARERAPAYLRGGTAQSAPQVPYVRRVEPEGWARLEQGRTLVERGRHAAAARMFRDALGMFERRDDRLCAGAAWYELGRLLRDRGAVAEAHEAFARAGERFRQAGATKEAIVAAASEGASRMDAGELGIAETVLRAANLAATQVAAASERVMVRAALVECVDWQGRGDDAQRLVEHDHPMGERVDRADGLACRASDIAGACLPRLEPDVLHRVRWHTAAATVALRRRALDEASSHMTAALVAAEHGPPRAVCAAEGVAVRFCGAVGDVEAVRVHAARGLAAARAARAPIDALRLRVRVAAALEAAGARGEAHALATRLARRRGRRLPALVGAELDLVLARILPDSAVARRRGARAEAFARASGAAALTVDSVSPARLPAPFGDIVDLLRRTHDCEDEHALLADLAEQLRARLAAVGVMFVSAQDPGAALAAAGSARGTAAARAVETGLVLGPLRTCAGPEIAAPVRCGGVCVGGLAARWAVTGPDDAGHARTLLAAAAAMAGPFLKAVLDRRHQGPPAADVAELLGTSGAMSDLRQAVARAAGAPFPVLIVGESGVGKELVARAIHRDGPRRLRPLAALNCAALTDDLVEAELFGHTRGAFTGAVAERRGLFEEADGGTLFLDEVADLSARAQAKLLRALQEGEVRRVGESFARHVEVRVVAASNRPLEEAEREGVFRRDLRYRLDVIRIDVPPLRDRVEDIPALAAAFWARVAPLTNCRARLGDATLAALARYDWPGNVRELQNVVAALAVAAPRHGVVASSLLPAAIARAAPVSGGRLTDARAAFERRFIAAALARAGGRHGRAAQELGVTRQGLGKLVKRLGVPIG